MRNFISHRVAQAPPSGIRKFFDIAATMEDVISLGIGEPDFITPEPILQAGISSLQRGETQYTSNSGTIELRAALSRHLAEHYSVGYDPESEILVTVGVSEALYLRDPDWNGVELCWDRPQEAWPRDPDGSLRMVTRPLDLADLARAGV